MQASSKVCWLSQVSVEDLALGSSPQNMTTPPLGPAPMALACLITSPDRSRPGVLPYQAPATPSTSAYSMAAPIWLPHTVAAASSSLSPGRCSTAWSPSSSASASRWRGRGHPTANRDSPRPGWRVQPGALVELAAHHQQAHEGVDPRQDGRGAAPRGCLPAASVTDSWRGSRRRMAVLDHGTARLRDLDTVIPSVGSPSTMKRSARYPSASWPTSRPTRDAMFRVAVWMASTW